MTADYLKTKTLACLSKSTVPLHLGIVNQQNVSSNSSVLQTIVLKKSLTAPKLFPQIDRFLFPVY